MAKCGSVGYIPFMYFLIQFNRVATRVKTVGLLGLPQPALQLVIPISFHLPSRDMHWSGPPESALQEPLPPSAYPAHSSKFWTNSPPYQLSRLQTSSEINITGNCCSVSDCRPEIIDREFVTSAKKNREFQRIFRN